jgi:hypothetical protein
VNERKLWALALNLFSRKSIRLVSKVKQRARPIKNILQEQIC